MGLTEKTRDILQGGLVVSVIALSALFFGVVGYCDYRLKASNFNKSVKTIGDSVENIKRYQSIPDVTGDGIRDWQAYRENPDGTYSSVIVPGVKSGE